MEARNLRHLGISGDASKMRCGRDSWRLMEISGDTLEDFPGVGAHHARIIYRSNNRKPEESPRKQEAGVRRFVELGGD
jgi:hypothetical protein